ncbi:MAG TPA: carboxypeptidase-like regulatory domain-containing protein, partial [Niastella sp.]
MKLRGITLLTFQSKVMQIIVCKRVLLLPGIGNKGATPKQCLRAVTGTTKMLRQAVRIMKLTAILLLGACIQIHAAGYGQKITLSERDAPIEKVLKKIQQQTSYKFLYTSQLLERTPKVTISVRDASVEEVLDVVLKGQLLDYEVEGNTVVIRPRKSTSITEAPPLTLAPPIEVRGVITDENGAPAQGVNVLVKGTNKGTTTNLKGEFVLNSVDDNAVLLISSVGYDRQEILVKKKTFISTQLRVAVGNLDELQVIAYGKTSKRFNTGNVATVQASDIEKQPVQNPLLALQGRVPGLLITQNSGVPGGGITVRIQGQNSISRGSDPLYVIDGVPYFAQLPSTGNDAILGSSGGSGFVEGNTNGSP